MLCSVKLREEVESNFHKNLNIVYLNIIQPVNLKSILCIWILTENDQRIVDMNMEEAL